MMLNITVLPMMNRVSYMPLLSFGNGPIHDGNIDSTQIFVDGDNIVAFMSRSTSYQSAFTVVSINANLDFTFYSSQIYNVGNHFFFSGTSPIIPLGKSRFLAICQDGTFYNLNVPNKKLNNKVPFTLFPSSSLANPCGQTYGNFASNNQYISAYTAVSNSQNSGYVYNAIYNKNNLSLVQGGMQGSYEGPNQTYFNVSVPQGFTQISNTNQTQSNGINTTLSYDAHGNYYSNLINYNIVPGLFNSCGPLPGNVPFPGNWSGARCTAQLQPVEFLYNGYQEYNNWFDTDIPGFVGGYSPYSYPDNNSACFQLMNGIDTYFIPINISIGSSPSVYGNKAAALADAIHVLHFFDPNFRPKPIANKAIFKLQNFARPVSVLGKYKS